MATTETKIVEIKVPLGDTLNQITALTAGINQLTDATKKLDKTNADEAKQIEINKLTIKDYQNQKRQLTNEVMKEVKVSNDAIGAYQKLQNEYSKAAAKAKDLAIQHGVGSEKATKAAEAANKMNERLKEADATVGLHVRNVGDYFGQIMRVIDALKKQNVVLVEEQKQLIANQKALTVGSDAYKKNEVAIKANETALKNNKAAISEQQKELANSNNQLSIYGGKFGGMIQGIQQFTTANGGLAGSFKAGGQAVMGFGKQLLALLANPIVAIIAAIAGAVMLLVSAMKQNGAATEKFNQILAPFKAMLAAITAVLGQLVSVFLDGILVLGNWANAIMSLIPGLDKVAERNQEAIRLEREKQSLIRQGIVDKAADAKEELRISELKKKIMQADKFSAEERLAFAREVDKAEKALALDDANRANNNLKNFLNNMKLQGKAQKDYTVEELQTLSDLQAAKYAEQQKYFDKTRRTASREATLTAELEKEAADKTKQNEELKRAEIEKTNAAKERQNAITEAEIQRLDELRQYIRSTVSELTKVETALTDSQKKQLQIVVKSGDEILKAATDNASAVLNASITANGKKKVLTEEEKQKEIDAAEEIKQKKIQSAFDIANGTADILQGAFNFSNALADAELQTWAEQNKGKANFDQEYAKKKAKLEHDAAVRNKAMQIVNTVINTGAAIMAQLATPGPAGIAASIAAGIAGALQIATIIATPIPSADGGGGGGGAKAASMPPDLTSKMASPLGNSVSAIQSTGGSNAITSGAANVAMAKANEPAIYAPRVELSLVELKTKQRQVEFIDNVSTLSS